MENEQPVCRMTNSFQLCAFGEPVGDWRSPNDTNTVLEQGIRGASLRNDAWTVTVAGALLLWLSDSRDAWGAWRRNGWKVLHVNRGYLPGNETLIRPPSGNPVTVRPVRTQSPHSSDESPNK